MSDLKQFMTREELHQALDEFKQAREALNRPFKFPPSMQLSSWDWEFLLAIGGIVLISIAEVCVLGAMLEKCK
jgi:hypothetical protein